MLNKEERKKVWGRIGGAAFLGGGGAEGVWRM